MSPPDLGTNLWGLAVHLFATRPTATAAYRELASRTCSPFDPADAAVLKGVSSLRDTRWYGKLCTRYARLRDALRSQRQADFDEVADVVQSIYPNGCYPSDFADTVQTCTAMLSFTITSDHITVFIEERCDHIALHELHEIPAKELTQWLVDGLILDALVPPHWYASKNDDDDDDDKTCDIVAVRRIGLHLRPFRMDIEYESGTDKTVRHRRIPLEGLLSATGPTRPVARRLAQSHGWLLAEAEIQRLLMKLQHLDAKQHEEEKEEDTALQAAHAEGQQQHTSSPAPQGTSASHAPALATSPTRNRTKPRKADVALLYRDPEAALDNVDLNDADDLTLQEFKDVMNEKFVANAVKPGDPGYEYDRRVEVAPATQKSAWDDEDSDDDID